MKLHRRLTLTMGVLLVIGLAVADTVTYTSLHSFLYGRLDNQLDASQRLALKYMAHVHKEELPVTETGLDNRLSQDVYLIYVATGGKVLVARPSGPPGHPNPAPVIPRSVKLSSGTDPAQGVYRPNPNDFDLSSAKGFRYRAQATAVPGGTLISAVPLASTDDTLASLLKIEILASLAVVLVLCSLALWTVRRGLRPLDDMARTAGAIASGDLTQRVQTVDDTTEVGRLGHALNTMLAQIEAAFYEKSRSEARLRQFVADASHELRTPLTSIRGYAELLRKGAFDDHESRHRALGRVEHEAARMGGLVDDLLLLARLDQGRPLERLPVDLRRICRDAVDDARLTDPQRVIELVAPAPVVVAGDHDRLAQVAHNLVGNALRHTPTEAPVRVEAVSAAGAGLLRVRDGGQGLDDQQLERVFDRFYRGDVARTGQGTGLGLSIVRAIADALGGRAWAESSPGCGSLFVVEVPLATGAAGAHLGAAVSRRRAATRLRALSDGAGDGLVVGTAGDPGFPVGMAGAGDLGAGPGGGAATPGGGAPAGGIREGQSLPG